MRLFAQVVTDKLATASPESIHRYLVIDTATAQGMPLTTFIRVSTSATDLLTQDVCNWKDTASPVLLELHASSYPKKELDRLREELNKWRYANNLFYIESSLTHDSLTQALYARTQAKLTENMAVMLRYFDTRIFKSLMQALSATQHDAFLSAGLSWTYPDRDGQAQQVESSGVVDSFITPLVLDDHQETQLMQDAEPDHIVGMLIDQNNAVLMEMTPPEQHARIKRVLDSAKALNIDQLSGQVAFCCVDLELGEKFYEQAPWVDSMPEIQNRQMQFSELVDRIAQKEQIA